MNNQFVVNAFIEVWGVLISSVAFICVVILMHGMNRRRNELRDVIVIYVVDTLALLVTAVGNYYHGVNTPIGVIAVKISNPSEFLLNELLQIVLSFRITSWFKEEKWAKIWRKIMPYIYGVYVVLIFSNFFTHSLFYVTANNEYTRGPLYFLTNIPAILIQFVNLALVIRYFKTVPKNIRAFISIYATIPIIGLLVQMKIYGRPIIPICFMILSVMIMFSTQQRSAEEMLISQQKLENQEIRMLVSQLHPHFLYNALVAVMGIEGNPPETVDAITRFSQYLRGNINAIRETNTIPVYEELKHVRAYLELEKLRFGDKLNFEINSNNINFNIPPLSLEVLVENAIRYGFYSMDKEGYITINMMEDGEWDIITVEDNGDGFDVDEVLSKPDELVDVKNVRRRVENMCGGKLEIDSKLGEGTKAIIMIPKTGGKK